MPGKPIRIALSPGRLKLLLSLVAVCLCVRETASESLTLSTTYPSPFGIYNQIVTTGSFGKSTTDTTLNRNGGNTILVPPSNPAGKVGIRTLAPAAALDVEGDVIINGTLTLKQPGAAVYLIKESCAFGGMLSSMPQCATTLCGGSSCYASCGGECSSHGKECDRTAPEICENTLLGHLTQ